MNPDRATQILRQVLATMEAEHVTDPTALESLEALRFALARLAKYDALAHRAAALIALRREADGKGYASGVEMELAEMAKEQEQ